FSNSAASGGAEGVVVPPYTNGVGSYNLFGNGWLNGYLTNYSSPIQQSLPNYGYYVWNLPAFGEQACGSFFGGGNCFQNFGWNQLPTPTITNPVCSPSYLSYALVPA